MTRMRERLTVLGFAAFVLLAIVGTAFALGYILGKLRSRRKQPVLAAAADDSIFDSNTWDVARNLVIFMAVVFWLATVYWVYKDARRRIEDPWLVAMATLLGAVPPFLGPLIYMLFRPPEYLEDVRERELEMLAIEERLRRARPPLPGLPRRGRAAYLVCPVCTTRLSSRAASARRRSSRSGRCARTARRRSRRAS